MMKHKIVLAHVVLAMLEQDEEICFPEDIFDYLGDHQEVLKEFFLGEDEVIDPRIKAKEVLASPEARDFYIQKASSLSDITQTPEYQAGYKAGHRVNPDPNSCPYTYEVPTHSSVQRIIDANELNRKNYKLWQRGFNDGKIDAMI